MYFEYKTSGLLGLVLGILESALKPHHNASIIIKIIDKTLNDNSGNPSLLFSNSKYSDLSERWKLNPINIKVNIAKIIPKHPVTYKGHIIILWTEWQHEGFKNPIPSLSHLLVKYCFVHYLSRYLLEQTFFISYSWIESNNEAHVLG